MRGPGKSKILKGFECSEFRRAVHSFLEEKCPDDVEQDEELSIRVGLEIIRQFITRRKSTGEEAPAFAPAT
jgi:hypothetical protein